VLGVVAVFVFGHWSEGSAICMVLLLANALLGVIAIVATSNKMAKLLIATIAVVFLFFLFFIILADI
jgi:hypothetical protein